MTGWWESVAALWRPRVEPPKPLPDEDAVRIQALSDHHAFVMANLIATLTPDERRDLSRLLDDRRFLEARRSD